MITKKNVKSKNKSILNKSKLNKSKKEIKTINILSYNVSWESTSGSVKEWPLCNNNTNINNSRHYSVCVNNISSVFDDNLDFITLQEATNYKNIISESKTLQNMNYEVHNSGLDVIVTFWKPKYKVKYIIKGEFENGRAWMAIVFKNDNICLINVHLGHYTSDEEIIKLDEMLFTIKSKMIENENKTKITKEKTLNKRIIISGDFNYNIKELGNSKNIITINDINFYYNPKDILTCLVKRKRHYDHIIDSYAKPMDINIPDVNYMASDHKPILGNLLI